MLATTSKQHCRTLQVERFFRQCRMLLRHCCRFWQQCCRFRRQCRTCFRQSRNKLNIVERNMFNSFRLCLKDKISFDIVSETGSIVAKNGNNVEATFDIVERTKFYNRIVQHCCRLWQQSRMLLRQCCLLLRHCCWCGRGIRPAWSLADWRPPAARHGSLRRRPSHTMESHGRPNVTVLCNCNCN